MLFEIKIKKYIENRLDDKIFMCYDLAIEKKTPLTERQKG